MFLQGYTLLPAHFLVRSGSVDDPAVPVTIYYVPSELRTVRHLWSDLDSDEKWTRSEQIQPEHPEHHWQNQSVSLEWLWRHCYFVRHPYPAERLELDHSQLRRLPQQIETRLTWLCRHQLSHWLGLPEWNRHHRPFHFRSTGPNDCRYILLSPQQPWTGH